MSIYPEQIIDSPVGRIKINFVGNNHLSVNLDGITIRGVAYRGIAHLDKNENGKFEFADFYQSLSLKKASGNAVRLVEGDASSSARAKANEVILKAVNDYVATPEGAELYTVGEIRAKLNLMQSKSEVVKRAEVALAVAQAEAQEATRALDIHDRNFISKNRDKFDLKQPI